MTLVDPRLKVEEMLDDFMLTLEALDKDILNHSIDGWPMGELAKKADTTAHELHKRAAELKRNFREFLLRQGISQSTDIFM